MKNAFQDTKLSPCTCITNQTNSLQFVALKWNNNFHHIVISSKLFPFFSSIWNNFEVLEKEKSETISARYVC